MRNFYQITIIVMLLALAGCGDRGGGGRRGSFEAASPRVVTFSPALTKIVFDMGLGNHVVGVTAYCTLPEGEKRQVVGSNLDVRVEPILAVRPDIMLVQMELKNFEALKRVNPDLDIEHFTISTLTDIADAEERIGELLGCPDVGLKFKEHFLARMEKLRGRTSELPRRSACFVMGTRNPSGAGKGTFIDDMITLAGGTNVLANRYEGWKNPGLETIIKCSPEVIICQCRPDEAEETAAYWRSLEYPDGKAPRVVTVTDNDWTIPAEHLLDYTEKLVSFIHPELVAEPAEQ